SRTHDMEPFLGQISTVAFNFAPRGWALCNGQLLSVPQNQALFTLLGTTYGGDGVSNFGLPDLRGRAAMQPHTNALGATGGVESVQLTAAQIPSHMHQANAQSVGGTSTAPSGNVWAASAS